MRKAATYTIGIWSALHELVYMYRCTDELSSPVLLAGDGSGGLSVCDV